MADQVARLQAALTGRYTIERELGRGGMATVYLAGDLKHRRPVALKVLRPELAAALGPERFLREIGIAARLNHPHILPLHDSGEADGLLYYVMPYVEGESLRSRLMREPQLPLGEALQIAGEVADALSYAHSHDVVHRDIKPENILLSSGHALVADFGIARAITVAAGDRLTQTGRTLGTPGYMSPEQAAGADQIDGRSDLYSLGCVLYELLAGHPPFLGATPVEVLARHTLDPVPSLRAVRRTVPQAVEQAIMTALEKVPADRFATVQQFAHALTASTLARPRRAGLRYRSWNFVRRHKTEVGAAAVMVTLIVGTLAVRRRGGHVSARPAVAVLGFRNLSGRSDVAWLSTALSQMVTTELAAGQKLRAISGEDIARMKIDLSLPDAETLGKATLGQIRANLGTDFIVLGSYVDLGKATGGQVRLDLRLQDAVAGETIASAAEAGTEANLFDLVTRAGARLREKLGVGEVAAAETSAVKASLPSNPEAARLFAEGLANLRAFDALTARDSLQQAVAAEPTFALAHAALAEAWSKLGYDRRAKEEARKAFELSTNLSREDRLSIEGRYRETTAEWERAIEVYRALFEFFPDNLDYGLRLAATQKRAARANDALATLDALRKLPALRADPRIDLAEADADWLLGDFRRATAAARRAGEGAKTRGARLLVASSLTSESWSLLSLDDLEGAAAVAKAARQIYASAGDRYGVAEALHAMGSVLYKKGDLAAAGRMYRENATIAAAIGNKHGEAVALNNLANVLYDQSNLSGAKAMYEQSLALHRELGDRDNEGRGLLNIAGVLYNQGDVAGSMRMYRQALEILETVGDKKNVEITLTNMAGTLYEQGDLTGAKRTYDQVLGISQRIGDKEQSAYALAGLGDVLMARGALAEARKAYAEALAIRHAAGEKGTAAKTQVALAELSIEEGHANQAEVPLREALEEFRRENTVDDEVSAHIALARALLGEGRQAEARKETDRAGELTAKSLDPGVKLRLTIIAARVRAASGPATDMAQAVKSLEAALAESAKYGFLTYQFEAGLALGEIEAKAGHSLAARARLVALEKDATAKGFLLIARKAHAASSD